MEVRKLVESILFKEEEGDFDVNNVSDKLTQLGIEHKIDDKNDILIYDKNSVISLSKFPKEFIIFRNGNIIGNLDENFLLYDAWDTGHKYPIKFTKSGFKKLARMY